MNKIKIVIPARYGSSRLPGKPLLDICGKPVILHVVNQCLSAGFFLSDIIVATDHADILNRLITENVPVKLTSTCHQSGTDRIHEIALSENWNDDVIVINVQGDEPLIPPLLIQNLADFSFKNKQFSITTAVTKINHLNDFNNTNVVKVILGEGGRALHFTRSPSPLNRDNQTDLSLAYRHVGIYSYSVLALKQFCNYPESPLEQYEKLEQLRASSNGMPIGAFIYPEDIPHGIDTIEDYQNIKKLMEQE